MKLFNRKDRSISIARPKAFVVHGVHVRKVPIGRYFEIMRQMGEIISDLLDAAFPGQSPGEVLASLTTLTPDQFRAMAVRLLGVVPDQLLRILCAILDADVQYVKDTLTPAELVRVWSAFWALNDLTDFFTNVRSATLQALGTRKASSGSSD